MYKRSHRNNLGCHLTLHNYSWLAYGDISEGLTEQYPSRIGSSILAGFLTIANIAQQQLSVELHTCILLFVQYWYKYNINTLYSKDPLVNCQWSCDKARGPTVTHSQHSIAFYMQLYMISGQTLRYICFTWWRHQMETFSALLAICAGNSPVPGEFPAQRPVTRSFDVFFDLRLNKRLSKQSWCRWFETLSRPLWRHCSENLDYNRAAKLWMRKYVTPYIFTWHWEQDTNLDWNDNMEILRNALFCFTGPVANYSLKWVTVMCINVYGDYRHVI